MKWMPRAALKNGLEKCNGSQSLLSRRRFLAGAAIAATLPSLGAPEREAEERSEVRTRSWLRLGVWNSGWDAPGVLRQCRASGVDSVTLSWDAVPGFRESSGSFGDELFAMVERLGEAGVEVGAMFGNVGAATEPLLDAGARREEFKRLSTMLQAMHRADVGVLINYIHTRMPEDPGHDGPLWAGLELLFRELAPASEQAGVRLANHGVWQCLPEPSRVRALQQGIRPADYRRFREEGLRAPWLVHTVDHIERLIEAAPNPANGLCFCTGMYAMGAWPPEQTRRFRGKIHFAQIRDIQGGMWPAAEEAFLGEGDLDFPAIFRSLKEAGFHGYAHPEHLGPARIDEGVWDRRSERSHLEIAATAYIKGIVDALDEPSRHSPTETSRAWPY